MGGGRGNTTVKLLLLYSNVYNATKPQISKKSPNPKNRKSHGSAKFCFASVGNDISVTHSAQAEEAERQLRRERGGRKRSHSVTLLLPIAAVIYTFMFPCLHFQMKKRCYI